MARKTKRQIYLGAADIPCLDVPPLGVAEEPAPKKKKVKSSVKKPAAPWYNLEPTGGDFDIPLADVSKYPMIPLTAPGMPPPGPNFMALAEFRGEEPADLRKINKELRAVKVGPKLTELYRQALYDPNFHLMVNVDDFQYPQPVRFIPGHRWFPLHKQAEGPTVKHRVMVIGKWPGYEEANACRNLCPTRLLKMPKDYNIRKMTNTADIMLDLFNNELRPGNVPCLEPRGELGWENWYVVNLIRFANPQNNHEKLHGNWIKDCLPLLYMDMRLVQPDYILCLGSDAAEAVLGKGNGVNNSSGKVFNYVIPLHTSHLEPPKGHPCKVVVIPHPVLVGKNSDNRPRVVGALRNFAHVLAGTRESIPAVCRPKHYFAVNHERELANIVDEIRNDPNGDVVSMDCEWHGLHPTETNAYLRTIQFSHKPGHAYCIMLRDNMKFPADKDWTAADDTHPPRGIFGPGPWAAKRQLERLLKQPRPDGRMTRIVGHNFKADMQWLKHWGLDLAAEFQAPPDDPDLDTNPDAVPGWVKHDSEGGFDTMLALHAVNETADFKLEAICSEILGVDRWDHGIREARKKWCAARKLKTTDLEGYGPFPMTDLFQYACEDVDRDRELFDVLNREGGRLDSDAYGFCSRLPFWISMRAQHAFMEMEETGLTIDLDRVDKLVRIYVRVYSHLLARLRKLIEWPTFNPASSPQCRTLLFGPDRSGVRTKEGKFNKDIRPILEGETEPRAKFLTLHPIKASGKPPKAWDSIKHVEGRLVLPSTDKEVLGILRAHAAIQSPNPDAEEIVNTLRGLRFVGQTLKGVLYRPLTQQKLDKLREAKSHKVARIDASKLVPDKAIEALDLSFADEDDTADAENNEAEVGVVEYPEAEGGAAPKKTKKKSYLSDEEKREAGGDWIVDERGHLVYIQGLIHHVRADGRVHTHMWQTKETGRASSSKPPLQNLSSKREADLEDFAGDLYEDPLRSVICAGKIGGDECVLVENDLKGAELYMMAVQCGDPTMIDHCERNNLDEGDSNYYDIHSSIAVKAFKLVVTDHIDKKSGKPAHELLKLPLGAVLPPTKKALTYIGKANLRKAAKTVVFGIPYGRGNDAIVRAVEEEGVKITNVDAETIREAIFGMYPLLDPFLQECQLRPVTHGYMVNCMGRRRRFHPSYDDKEMGEQKRQAGNFNIQGGVADLVSRSLDLFYNYPGRFDGQWPRYRLALQIHDAVLSEVRIKDLAWYIEEVVPACMTSTPFYRCNLDGERISDKPYRMGTSTEIMRSWGVEIERKEGLALGIPEKYLPKEKAS